jgi:pyruvate,water dikinase
MSKRKLILWLDSIGLTNLPAVGGKNASLGEMQQQLSTRGVRLAPGFATTADMFRDYLAHNQLQPRIDSALAALASNAQSLADTGAAIRAAFLAGQFTDEQTQLITEAYAELCARSADDALPVAVRSSATAEDLPEASFAGQQESYLNIRGADALLEACRQCFASLYTDRAIAYREENGFAHESVALSVGVQQMVAADAAGVMFTLDTESGFPDVITISANWGLGETIVKGSVNPDRFMVFKPLLNAPDKIPVIEKRMGSKLQKLICNSGDEGPTRLLDTTPEERGTLVLSDAELLQLARWAADIETHYGKPMDMEWARAGNGDLYILQARPETVESHRDRAVLVSYKLRDKGTVLAEGASVGSAIVVGPVCHASSPAEVDNFPAGGILVTERTDPDWMPIMRKMSSLLNAVKALVSLVLKTTCSTLITRRCYTVMARRPLPS